MGRKGTGQPWNRLQMSARGEGPGWLPQETHHVREERGHVPDKQGLKTCPCLDSVTAKVFYFLEQLDQRTSF